MPRWIDHQAGKGDRLKAARAEHDARVARHVADLGEIKAFRREQGERKPDPTPRRGIQPGERHLPDLSDEDLRQALGKANRTTPVRLDYPHLLIFRERGFTRQVWADVGAGEFGATTYRGDVLTEVGEKWLRET